WVRLRKPSSLTFSVLETTWSGSLNSMPASASCSSNFSTGVFTSAASLRMVVCCDIRFPFPEAPVRPARLSVNSIPAVTWAQSRVHSMAAAGTGSLEPVLARLHDQRGGAGLVHALVDGQLVGGQVGQVVAGDDAIGGQRVGQHLVHAFHRQQVLGRLLRGELLLRGQRPVEQRVPGAGAPLPAADLVQ